MEPQPSGSNGLEGDTCASRSSILRIDGLPQLKATTQRRGSVCPVRMSLDSTQALARMHPCKEQARFPAEQPKQTRLEEEHEAAKL